MVVSHREVVVPLTIESQLGLFFLQVNWSAGSYLLTWVATSACQPYRSPQPRTTAMKDVQAKSPDRRSSPRRNVKDVVTSPGQEWRALQQLGLFSGVRMVALRSHCWCRRIQASEEEQPGEADEDGYTTWAEYEPARFTMPRPGRHENPGAPLCYKGQLVVILCVHLRCRLTFVRAQVGKDAQPERTASPAQSPCEPPLLEETFTQVRSSAARNKCCRLTFECACAGWTKRRDQRSKDFKRRVARTSTRERKEDRRRRNCRCSRRRQSSASGANWSS